MEKYLFRDKYFAISEEGLHLLRNGFNYKTIGMSEIRSVRLGRGKSIKNWILLFLLGVLILTGSYYYGRSIWYFLTNPDAEGSIYVEEIASVVIGTLIGSYCIFLSLKIEEVIEFKTTSKSENFSTKQLKEEGLFDELIRFLRQHKSVIED